MIKLQQISENARDLKKFEAIAPQILLSLRQLNTKIVKQVKLFKEL